jgi:hypothetical protein
MNKKVLELIVKSVVAGMVNKYGVEDLDSATSLLEFGIDDRRVARLKKQLWLALSGAAEPEPKKFLGELKITSASSIAAVAAQLPVAYRESVPAASRPKGALKFDGLGKGAVEVTVCTSLAQYSRKYSVVQIKPQMKLKDLGLDQAGMAQAKVGIYRSVAGAKPSIGLNEYISSPGIRSAPTVGDLVNASVQAFSLSGDETPKQRG